jgi:hypothetical protein
LQTYLAALRVAVQGYDLSIQLQQEVKETKGEADAEPTARKRLVSEEQHQANLAVLRSIKIHKENNPEEAAPTPVKAEGQTGLFDSNPTKPEPVKPGARGDVKETASKTYLVSDEELAEVTERLKAKK